MTEVEYLAMTDGWRMKQGMEEAMFRRLAYVVASSAGAKVNSEQALWKIPVIDQTPIRDLKQNIELLKQKAKEMQDRKNKAG